MTLGPYQILTKSPAISKVEAAVRFDVRRLKAKPQVLHVAHGDLRNLVVLSF